MVTYWMQIAVRLRNGLRKNSIKIMAPFRVIEPKSIRLGDMFVELPAMSSHILLCILTTLRLLSISPVVQYSQLSESFITQVIVSKKLAAIFQTAN